MTDSERILVVTRRCNLACSYCPVDQREADLPVDLAQAHVRRAVAEGIGRIRLTGGEPTLAWPTVQAVIDELAAAHAAGGAPSLELCTNGLELDRARLRALERPWLRVVVTVDGPADAMAAVGRRPVPHLEALLALPGATVTQTIPPHRAHEALGDLLYLWARGARRFNVLPAYYTRWPAAALRDLDEALASMAAFLHPRVADGRARVANLDRGGSLPLFNDAPCVDVDGRVHRTNLVLTPLASPTLLDELTGDGAQAPPLPPDLRQRLEADLPAAVRRSNQRVDALLHRFVHQLRAGPPPLHTPRRARRPERLEFHIEYGCDNRCAFCSESDRLARWRDHPVSAREITRTLRSHAAAGGRHVNLTGGEPTAHPAFAYALELARGLGLRTYVGTNGSRLADPTFAARVLPWLDELSLSLHGPDAARHDRLTGRPGSFDALVAAAGHARAHGRTSLMANVVATTRNVDDLAATLSRCADLGLRQVLISSVAPEGRALPAYGELAVPLARWKTLAPDLCSRAHALGLRARLFGLPLCALGEVRIKSNDLYFDPRVTVERAAGPRGSVRLCTITTRHPRRGRRRTRRCRGCHYRGVCGGVFGAYLDRFGDAEIEAIHG